MKQDRSGRTLEDYRELFWAEQKESKRLSDGLVKANNISMAAEQVKQEFEAGYLRKKARVEELEAVLETSIPSRVRELEAELKQCRNHLVVCKKRNKNLMLMLHKSAIGEQSDE